MTLLTSDRQLLEAFRRGDRAALERVYNEYAPRIATFIRKGFHFQSKGKMLQFQGFHQPSDVQDVLQETFVKAFSDEARVNYDGVRPYLPYLSTITKNIVISLLRTRAVLTDDAPSQCLDEHDDRGISLVLLTSEGPDAELLQKELKRILDAFCVVLPLAEKDYFEARFGKRLNRRDAAHLTGFSEMQARTLETKLRKRFLVFMHHHGYFDDVSQ